MVEFIYTLYHNVLDALRYVHDGQPLERELDRDIVALKRLYETFGKAVHLAPLVIGPPIFAVHDAKIVSIDVADKEDVRERQNIVVHRDFVAGVVERFDKSLAPERQQRHVDIVRDMLQVVIVEFFHDSRAAQGAGHFTFFAFSSVTAVVFQASHANAVAARIQRLRNNVAIVIF